MRSRMILLALLKDLLVSAEFSGSFRHAQTVGV